MVKNDYFRIISDAKPKTMKDLSKHIDGIIGRNIGVYLDYLNKNCGRTDNAFITFLKEKFDLKCDKEALSKIRTGDLSKRIHTGFIIAFACYAKVTIEDLFVEDFFRKRFENEDRGVEEKQLEKEIFGNIYYSGSDIISDPARREFYGYVNTTFDIFFLSTISKERQMITGTMMLSEKNGYCEVKLTLQSTEENTTSFSKSYTGNMIISPRQQACYCVVASDELGELNSIVFHHKYFHKDSLKVKMATVTTVSAGDEQRPTMHRMVICKQGVINTEKQKRFIYSQLRMNRSQIIISEKSLYLCG